MQYPHIISAVLDHPWAISPRMLRLVASVLARHIAGREMTPAEAAVFDDARAERCKRLADTHALAGRAADLRHAGGDGLTTAVLPVHGTLVPRGDELNASGTTSAERLGQDIGAHAANSQIDQIVLDVEIRLDRFRYFVREKLHPVGVFFRPVDHDHVICSRISQVEKLQNAKFIFEI